MTKKSNVKLFKKTFQKKSNENNNENQERPLTATLEKPQVLNIKFINTIDMSLMRKELLCITNLCRAPFRITKLPKRISMKTGRRTAIHRPLSLPSCDDRLSVISKRTQRSEASEDSWESEESSSVSQIPSARSKKINRNTMPSALSMGSNQRTKTRPEKKITNDPNNNQKLTKLNVQIPDNTNLSTDIKKRTSQSIKLPEPCKTCGRPDQPERFHSHPATPLKPIVKKATMEIVQLPTKSSVQKPFAMKYKSKVISKPPPLPTQVIVHSPPEIGTGKVLNERPKTGKGPKTLMCYLCGREFGTTSLKLHEPKCTEKWERENASLPPSQRRKLPKKPEGALTKEEWNDYASKTNQAFLIPCENCSRTFLPDRLLVHQRSCKPQHNMSKLSSDSNNSSLSRTSSPSAPPTSVECSICGRLFGKKSIKIHEPQCLKKQQYDNNQAKSRFSSNHNKSPLPTVSQKISPNIEKPVERPTSAKKPPMFPCYLCGRLFSVNSIYIHEPQCLKKWKTENEKLPPNLKRQEPIKPDIKFTPDGKIDYDATSDSNWQTHLNQLVACDVCGRTFNPERVEVHQRSCKG